MNMGTGTMESMGKNGGGLNNNSEITLDDLLQTISCVN